MTLARDALILDMDGLMVDSEPLWWSVERALAREHGHAWTDEMAEQCVGTGLPNTVRTLCRLLGIEMATDEGVAWLIDGFIARIDELALKPGCAELIVAARDASLPVALASSSPARLIDAVLGRFDLSSQLDAVVSGESVARPKPAPDIFLHTAKLLGVKHERAVVLEDSLAGVRAARAAAMPVIAVPEHDPEAFADLTTWVVADLHEARRLLGL